MSYLTNSIYQMKIDNLCNEHNKLRKKDYISTINFLKREIDILNVEIERLNNNIIDLRCENNKLKRII